MLLIPVVAYCNCPWPMLMNASNKKTVIILGGPTAVGKTSRAIEVAKHFKTEIISADSRQCFKELNIGVARPSEKELKEIKHYFIASHSIQEAVNAVTFGQYALQKVSELFTQQEVVVMVGGTGLYIRAFCGGLDPIPPVDPATREQIIKSYTEKGLEWLQQEIKEKDPAFYTSGEIQNPQRVMRALEVVESTGQSVLSFRSNKKKERGFSILKIGLELPKEDLHRNISTRVDKMMESGLIKEVEGLIPFSNMNALQTVGYTELFDHLSGKSSLEEAIERIKTNTRQYAKRQMTWFKKEDEIRWFSPGGLKEIIAFTESEIL